MKSLAKAAGVVIVAIVVMTVLFAGGWATARTLSGTPLLADTPFSQITSGTDQCEEVDALADEAGRMIDAGFDEISASVGPFDVLTVQRGVENRAILAEQHPECFTPSERVLIESFYRGLVRHLDAQTD